MFDLNFQVEGVEPVDFAAVPQLAFRLRVEQSEPRLNIHSIALRIQIRIEATKRRYDAQSQAALVDLFAQPDRWRHTLRSLLWQHVSVVVPGFMESAHVEMNVPCTFDFNVAATKYFYGLTSGDVPLCLLFSGTVFYEDEEGHLQVAQIPWEKEAEFRLPVETWRKLMDRYYPDSAWLCLRRGAFQELLDYKQRHGLPTWEGVVERLLASEQPLPQGAGANGPAKPDGWS